MISSYFEPQFCDSPLYFAPVNPDCSKLNRRILGFQLTLPSKTRAALLRPPFQKRWCPRTRCSGWGGPTPPRIEIVFGREGRLGTRTIRITAMGENRTHDTVSTVSRVSDHGDRAGLNHPPPGLEQAL